MIQATVLDAHGNPVQEQTLVFAFTTNTSGASLSPLTGVTDTNGRFTVTYTAGTTAGTDTVQARTTNGIIGTVSITVAGTSPPASVTLTANPATVQPGGLSTIQATVKDAKGNPMAGQTVVFTFITNATMASLTAGPAACMPPPGGACGVTSTNGLVAVTYKAGTAGTNPSTDTVQASTTNGITATVSITVCTGMACPSAPTGAASTATDRLTTGGDPKNQTITVTALGAMATETLSVSLGNFAITTPAPPTEVPLNTPQTVTVHWDKAGVNQVGQMINFFATRGDFAATPVCPATLTTISTTTDGKGNATVYICADNAGPAVISAAANVSHGPSSQVEIEFVATTVNSLVLQATPTTLSVNPPGSTAQQSVITAVARDTQGNLVKNQTVSFSLHDVSGGHIFLASDVTDSVGQVATASPSTVTTDTSGFAFFNVVYAKQYTWVEVALEARTVVAGTEGSSQAQFFLLGAASDFNDCTVSPPGQISPYGIAMTCADPL